jgi:hypothetical protein
MICGVSSTPSIYPLKDIDVLKNHSNTRTCFFQKDQNRLLAKYVHIYLEIYAPTIITAALEVSI